MIDANFVGRAAEVSERPQMQETPKTWPLLPSEAFQHGLQARCTQFTSALQALMQNPASKQ